MLAVVAVFELENDESVARGVLQGTDKNWLVEGVVAENETPAFDLVNDQVDLGMQVGLLGLKVLFEKKVSLNFDFNLILVGLFFYNFWIAVDEWLLETVEWNGEFFGFSGKTVVVKQEGTVDFVAYFIPAVAATD